MKIVVLSSSIRKGRKSHSVALFLKQLLEERGDVDVHLFDLKEANFPLFEERLSHQDNPSKTVKDYAALINSSDAIFVVCPEYNGGYPASFKNAFDLLFKEWVGKPIGIFSVSGGRLGGAQVMQKLQLLYTKIGSLAIGPGIYVASVDKVFDESGNTKEEWMVEQSKKYIEKVIGYIDRGAAHIGK